MITPFLILLIAISLFGLGGIASIWLFLRWRKLVKSKMPPHTPVKALPFRWRYIMLPTAIFFLSVFLVTYFYHQLPNEVACHFKPDGSPDRWLSREAVTAWMLSPQLILALLAGAITMVIAKLATPSQKADGDGIDLESVLPLMGNMIGLPQLVLCFAMLDIFSYNAYRIHLMPLWLFALIVMGLGAIILGIVFVSAVRRAQRAAR